jgi:Skp family chaperone for outer membrane proteins
MSRRFFRPAATPEDREQQLISLAYDEAETMMREHRAPAQIVNHFLKAGSQRESWELQRMAREVELLEAKVQSLASARRVEELYAEALEAMRTYAGQEVETLDDYEEGHHGR